MRVNPDSYTTGIRQKEGTEIQPCFTKILLHESFLFILEGLIGFADMLQFPK